MKMDTTTVDLEHFDRKESFEYYSSHKLSINLSLKLDVTKMVEFIKKNKLRSMPVTIWVVSKVVNSIENFRYTLDEHGELCVYKAMHPGYVVLNEKTKNISCIYTEYSDDFSVFYKQCIEDMALVHTNKLFPIANEPKNIFSISCMPGIGFESFHIGFRKVPLTPIFATGKYTEEKKKLLMPFSIQVNHAFCDGYHIQLLIDEINQTIQTLEQLNPF